MENGKIEDKNTVELIDLEKNPEKPKDIEENILSNETHVQKQFVDHEFSLTLPPILDTPPDEKITIDENKKDSDSTSAPDGFNAYRNKKTLTQGMLDFALFSSNIGQLRSIIDQLSQDHSNVAYCWVLIVMLTGSLLLQVAIGLALLLSTRYNVNNLEERRIAYEFGNYVVVGIFLVTVINIFIASFGTPQEKFMPYNDKTNITN